MSVNELCRKFKTTDVKTFLHSYASVQGVKKSPLTTLNLNNLKIKSRIAKPNTYLKTRGLHNYFDTKHDARTSFNRDVLAKQIHKDI